MLHMHKMKNAFVTGILLTSMVGETYVSANSTVDWQKAIADEQTTSEAGTTPDSILYTFDKFLEDLQLAITADSEKESELLLQFAKERLAEAKVMTQSEKQQFVKEAVEAYMQLLAQSQEKVSEAIHEGELTSEKQEQLTNQLEETANVDEKSEETISQQLDESTKEALTETQETTKAVANVVKGIDENIVQSLRNQGFGYGEIAKIVALAEATGKTVEEIAAAVKEGKGFGELAKENGLHPKQIATMIKEKRLAAELEEAKANGDDKKVERLQKKLAKLEKKKVDYANKKNKNNMKDEKAEAAETGDKTAMEDATNQGKTEEDVEEESQSPANKVENQKKETSAHEEKATDEAKKHEVKAKEDPRREEKAREKVQKHEEKASKEEEKRAEEKKEHEKKNGNGSNKENKDEDDE